MTTRMGRPKQSDSHQDSARSSLFPNLMILPVLAPKYLQQQLGVELKENWLLNLADHNQTLLEQGLFTFPSPQPSFNDTKGEQE